MRRGVKEPITFLSIGSSESNSESRNLFQVDYYAAGMRPNCSPQTGPEGYRGKWKKKKVYVHELILPVYIFVLVSCSPKKKKKK